MKNNTFISVSDVWNWLSDNRYKKEIGAKEYSLFQSMLKDVHPYEVADAFKIDRWQLIKTASDLNRIAGQVLAIADADLNDLIQMREEERKKAEQ